MFIQTKVVAAEKDIANYQWEVIGKRASTQGTS